MGSTTKERLCFGPCICYRLQTKSRKGNVFTSGCQEFCPQDVCVSQNALGRGLCIITCTGGVSARGVRMSGQGWGSAWGCLPRGSTKEGCIPPGPEADTTPSPDGHCSGRYASYWNVFLFLI